MFSANRLGLLIGGGLCLVGWFMAATQPIYPQVIACDVGQGDAILLRYGTVAVLVDVGRKQGILPCLRYKLALGQTSIQTVLLTHWDDDHIGAFSDVAAAYRIGTVISNPNIKDSTTAQQVVETIKQARVNLTPSPGDELVFPGGRVRFVWSATAISDPATNTTENDRSIGIVASFKSFGFLGLGDLECASELAVSNLPLLISTPILKISHHGSKTSSCTPFIAKIEPEIAILSVGEDNKYGHPAAEILAILRDQATTVLRTDQLGSLEIQRKGKNWLWRSQRWSNSD